MNDSLEIALVVSFATFAVGAYAGQQFGIWVAKLLIKIRSHRIVLLASGLVLGAIAGALALVVIWEVSDVLSYYTGIAEFEAEDVQSVVLNVFPLGSIVGGSIGGAVGLLLAVLLCAFPPPKRIKLDL